MRKKGQPKPEKSTSEGISIEQSPFTAKERIALKEIAAIRGGWSKKKLKDKFIAEHGRIPEEVDTYIKTEGRKVIGNNGSTASAPINEAPVRSSEGSISELRVGFKGLRIEGNVLIIEIER